MKISKILIVDDHAILRSGLKMLISNEKDMKVVGEAADGRCALERFKALCPDIVLLDITLPDMNGLEVARKIRKCDSKAQILVLTMHDNVHYVREFLKVGVSGYVLKKSADTDLIKAIRSVGGRDMFVDPSLAETIVKEYAGSERNLSPREEEVLTLVVKGFISKEIGAHLKISAKTVDTYRRRIVEKLGISSRVELLRYAVKKGLFNPAIE